MARRQSDPPQRLSDLDLPEGPAQQLVSALATLPDKLSGAVTDISELRSLARGTVIVAEGVEATEVGYVLDGTLGMRKLLPDGREHIIGLMVPGDLFGRVFNGPCEYDIVALTEVQVVVMARDGFETILRDAPELERIFLVSVLDELDAAREWIMLMSGHKALERVAAFLTILLRRLEHGAEARGGSGAPVRRLRLPLQRKDLAHYLGIRVETLSRALHELENRGVLRLLDPYLIELCRPQALLEIAGQDLLYGDDHG